MGAGGVRALLDGAARAEDDGLRRHALETAVDVAPRACVEALIAALSDRSPAVRLLAARRLGWMREPRAAEPLRGLLPEPPTLSLPVAIALAKLGDAAARDKLRAQAQYGAGELVFAARYGLSLLGEDQSPPMPEVKELDGGRFMMGDDKGDDNEKPAHPVSIRAFEIGVYQTTFAEYDAFCDATDRRRPGDEGWGRDRRPVIYVSWEDAQAYVAWLSEITCERWRLPSEAEWEYACRAGSSTAYSFGDDAGALDAHAWFMRNSGGQTHPVGEKAPNGFGLYDMHGNVREWCQDAWNDTYQDAPADGSAWILGDTSLAVLRGGSWFVIPRGLRSALRFRTPRDNRGSNIGFRVARTIIPL